jgi:hypothetical protein
MTIIYIIGCIIALILNIGVVLHKEKYFYKNYKTKEFDFSDVFLLFCSFGSWLDVLVCLFFVTNFIQIPNANYNMGLYYGNPYK